MANLNLFHLLSQLAIEFLRFTELLLVFVLDGRDLFLFCPKMMLVDLLIEGEYAVSEDETTYRQLVTIMGLQVLHAFADLVGERVYHGFDLMLFASKLVAC